MKDGRLLYRCQMSFELFPGIFVGSSSSQVGRAGSMVGGAGRRVGGVVGGVVGLVWRGPGRAEAASTENFDDIGVDGPAAHGEG